MTDLDSRCLDAFPGWLKGLGEDARALAEIVENKQYAPDARRQLVAALNYLFKSLDLIPDGIEDLGFIDDAFVFRVAVTLAADSDPSLTEGGGVPARLAGETALVAELLEGDHERLVRYVRSLDSSSSRGRSVDDILSDDAVAAEFVRDLKTWADGYQPPSFSREPKNLVKLRAFLAAKLPA